jgi:uncharacterized protein YfiM (DUF2279 family)
VLKKILIYISFSTVIINSHAQQNHINVKKADSLSKEQVRRRVWLVDGGNVIGYSAAMVGLYNAWYRNYPQSHFHFFNDNNEWLQIDKAGHFYSAYIESRGSMELWRWTGINRKTRIWLGGMSGAVYQTVIEILDGFSSQWGFSWGDFTGNILGSSLLTAQELAWDEQRIKLKFSFHRKSYADPALNQRSDVVFGKSLPSRFIKDYNGQSYWLSVNVKDFFPQSKWPKWLQFDLGYGAEGMFGASSNVGKDANGNIIFDRRDINRRRQWYLAPDIDLSKIKTRSRALNFFLTFLSAFKFPTPALEFSQGKFMLRGFYF